MSTRALYTFKGSEDSGSPHDFNVYKHHDGYPTGAAGVLNTTIKHFAWVLPRYESDAFAAAFCAAAKCEALHLTDVLEGAPLEPILKDYANYRQWQGGGVRLMPQGDPVEVAERNCSDIDYRYEIWFEDNNLQIKCFEFGNNTPIYSGPFNEFVTWAHEREDAA